MGGDNGVKVEWFSGTCVKDTWTNQRGVGSGKGGEDGWGEEEWRGGNGDNCT